MPALGTGPWLLITAIAIAASLGTLHIICKRLATDREIARMVREARALRQEQERRLEEMRLGSRRRRAGGSAAEPTAPETILEVGAADEAADDVIIVGEAPPMANAA